MRRCSLDHLIRPVENRRGNGYAKLLSRLEVDDQFKLGWPFYGEVNRISALKDLIHVTGHSPEQASTAHPIVHEATSVY